MSHAELTSVNFDLSNPLYKIAQLIADTNQPGRWAASGRTERERRVNEADAILKYMEENFTFLSK